MVKSLMLAAFVPTALAVCGGNINGKVYDFTGMEKATGDYAANTTGTAAGITLHWNFCKELDVSSYKCEADPSLAKVIALAEVQPECVALGEESALPTISEYKVGGDTGVSLTYTDTSAQCSNGGASEPNYSLLLNVVCDMTATTADKWVIKSAGQTPSKLCQYYATMESAYGCEGYTPAPDPPTPSPTTPGPSPGPNPPADKTNTCLNVKSGDETLIKLGVPTQHKYTTVAAVSQLSFELDASCSDASQVVAVDKLDVVPDAGLIATDRFNPASPGPTITKTKAADLVVDYTCPNKDYSNYTIVLTITFPGSESKTVNATWVKHCFPRHSPTPAPAAKVEGGWSTTGIVFFTGFMLTLVFCVLGCGYNYVQQGRSGTDIIPCIGVFRACKDKVSGGGGTDYSPQMDYTSADGERASGDGGDGAYGSVYQSDL